MNRDELVRAARRPTPVWLRVLVLAITGATGLAVGPQLAQLGWPLDYAIGFWIGVAISAAIVIAWSIANPATPRVPTGPAGILTLLERNLERELPLGVRPFMEPGERGLVIIPGTPGAIVATDRRVIVERKRTPLQPAIYAYRDLTGVRPHLALNRRPSVELAGPELPANQRDVEILRSKNATFVSAWHVDEVRVSAVELDILISEMNTHAAALGSLAIASPDNRPTGFDTGAGASQGPQRAVGAVRRPVSMRQRVRRVPRRGWVALTLVTAVVLIVGGLWIASIIQGPGHVTTLTFLTPDS